MNEFWKLISGLRAHREEIARAFGELGREDLVDDLRNMDKLCREQDHSKLDAELGPEVWIAVLEKVRKLYLLSPNGSLYEIGEKSAERGQGEVVSAVEVFRQYGAEPIWKVEEYGSFPLSRL